MGWKATTVIINEGGDGYLGMLPKHDPGKARGIIDRLGLRFGATKITSFRDQGIYQPRDWFAVGAYPLATIISDGELLDAIWPGPKNPLMEKILGVFPRAVVLSMSLHSNNDHWGYALWEAGVEKRRFMGDGDNGIIADEGALQPQEQRIFEKSRMDPQRGRIFWDPVDEEELEPCQVGASLVFAMAERCFGSLINQPGGPDFFQLDMEMFQKKSKSVWWPF